MPRMQLQRLRESRRALLRAVLSRSARRRAYCRETPVRARLQPSAREQRVQLALARSKSQRSSASSAQANSGFGSQTLVTACSRSKSSRSFPKSSRRSSDSRSWVARSKPASSACATIICSTISNASERADDAPFGGGPGMVLRIEPIARALDAIIAEAPPARSGGSSSCRAPAGRPFDQRAAERWRGARPLDLRLRPLRGHRRPARAALPRRGVFAGRFRADRGRDSGAGFHGCDSSPGSPASVNAAVAGKRVVRGRRLDYPSYTRPAGFRGVDVPDVLLSGDHAEDRAVASRRVAPAARPARRRRPAPRRGTRALHPQEKP